MKGTWLIFSTVIVLTRYAAGWVTHQLVCESEKMVMTCPENQYISLLSVEFGRRDPHTCFDRKKSMDDKCMTTDQAIRTVSNKCQYRRTCEVTATVNYLGDPCSGVGKYLEVDYECHDGLQEELTICEGQTMAIACPNDTNIVIADANYGRTDPDICPSSNPVWSNLCRFPASTAVAARQCDGKRECKIKAQNEVFGKDICVYIQKHLQVKYLCVDELDYRKIL